MPYLKCAISQKNSFYRNAIHLKVQCLDLHIIYEYIMYNCLYFKIDVWTDYRMNRSEYNLVKDFFLSSDDNRVENSVPARQRKYKLFVNNWFVVYWITYLSTITQCLVCLNILICSRGVCLYRIKNDLHVVFFYNDKRPDAYTAM